MNKIFHFDSQADPYRADACVVSCFDARFEQFLKKRGIWWADPLKIAGGAKTFASPAEESERSFRPRTGAHLRAVAQNQTVMLMLHSDCGAYGGLQAFGGDQEREAANHESELRRAEEFLRTPMPTTEVECFYLRFTGVWALEAAQPDRRGIV